MERRSNIRTPIRLDAKVHDRKNHTWPFIIEDFGYDGMCLRWNSKLPISEAIHVDDILDVEFITAHQGGTQEYHIEVRVVRIDESVLAVSLYNPALDSMLKISLKQQQSGALNIRNDKQPLDKKSQDILQLIETRLVDYLSRCLNKFFLAAEEVLFQRAKKGVNNSEQTLFIEAITTLKKIKVILPQEFIQLMKHQLCVHNQQNYSESQDRQLNELGLVEQREFENVLVINRLIGNTSPQYKQELLEIKLRLAHLSGISIKELNFNPLSPEIIYKAFGDTLQHQFSNKDVLLLLYQQFEQELGHLLFDLYKDVNKIFIDNNILPLIEKKYYILAKETMMASQRQLQDSGDKRSAVTSGFASQPALSSSAPNPAQHMTELNVMNNNVNLLHAFESLKELTQFNNGEVLDKTTATLWDEKKHTEQLHSIVAELTSLQKARAISIQKDKKLPENSRDVIRLAIRKENYSIELNNEFDFSLDVIDRIFCSIQNDKWLSNPVKELLSLMQIPLLKVALLHKDFFEAWSNPARMVVNQLAMLDCDSAQDKLYIKVHTFVILLLKKFHTDLKIFSKLQKALTQLLDIQSNEYNKKIDRCIKKWDIRQAVIHELVNRLKNKSVPQSIVRFIGEQWLDVLINTYTHQGKDSQLWLQYLQLLDSLISLTGDHNDNETFSPEAVLLIIEQGFNSIKASKENTISDIKDFIAQAKSGQKMLLKRETIYKLLFSNKALSETAMVEADTSKEMIHSNMSKMIAQRLVMNDYVLCKLDSKLVRLQFIWMSDSREVFVFIGRYGLSETVFDLSKMESMIDNEELSQTQEFDLPFLERSMYAMLGEVHDKIAQKNKLDKITGLMKHQDFDLYFADQLSTNRQDMMSSALCLINIDQFKLINDTCGFEAGNQYLSEIAQKINQQPSADTVIARYGIDEFILLLKNHSEESAKKIAEVLRKVINSYDFSWEQKTFTLTASIGLVMLHEFNDVKIYLKAVATATAIAKENGRNRVHCIEHDDLELDRRKELQHWATKVDHMIKNDYLDIRCQRIHPIANESLQPHYEMLLLIKDDDGHILPPSEFIEAAELYNKMADVDRWVIEYVFKWYFQNPEQLTELGGVAINLSGHSLNNVDFLDFIYETFIQYPVPAELICFEITETVAITNMSHAINCVQEIKKLGCEFSLDDFGTGLSSYAYLKDLPVDYLKIDGVFIKDIVNNPSDQAMVKSINEIGHFLGMKTIAEYVENDEIKAELKAMGVDYAQGYGVQTPFLIKNYVRYSPEQK